MVVQTCHQWSKRETQCIIWRKKHTARYSFLLNTGQSCLALKSVMLHQLIGGQSPGIMDGFFVVKKQKLSNFPKQVEGDGVGHLYFDSLTLPHNYPNYK